MAELARDRVNQRFLPEAAVPGRRSRSCRRSRRARRRGRRAADRRAEPRVSRLPGPGGAAAAAGHARGVGHEGLRARDRQAAAPGRDRGARHGRADGRAVGADVRAGSGARPADGHDGRLARPGLRDGTRAAAVRRQLPGLRLDRHDRGRGRRRDQERARDRRRHLGRPGLRRQHARRADHARPRRDDASRRRARRRTRTRSWGSPGSATSC